MTDSETDHPTQFESANAPSPDALEATAAFADALIENVETVIVGHRRPLESFVTALLARGHVLLEDVPGVGKTMLARAIARSIDGSFKRVQFTPDLLPSDVTGVNVFNQQTRAFEFQPGPVFANVVLGDEINRAPPKTQSALLEAMEEAQVTVDGETYPVPSPYTVIATQNTVEGSRNYDLPIAQLDRFLMKLTLGYPNESDETALLDRVLGAHPIEDVEPIATVDALADAQETTASVIVSEPVRSYVTKLARYTRRNAELGVSPRGAIALVRGAQGHAVLAGREYVVPEDVQAVAHPTLDHRLLVEGGETGRDVIDRALDSVSVP